MKRNPSVRQPTTTTTSRRRQQMADGGHMEESEEINQSYEEDDLINLNSGEAVSDEDSDRPE